MLTNKRLKAFVSTIKPDKAREFYETKIGLRLLSEDNFGLEFEANGAHLRVTIVEKFTPQPFTVMGWDTDDISSTVIMLMENGIKYTPKGGVVNISSYTNDGYVCINVKDNGMGISGDDIKYIFDRFYRADRSRKRESGSGLGLSISKWIAEAHKGAIEVASQPSKGSQFLIKLPI